MSLTSQDQQLLSQVVKAIRTALSGKLHAIGSVIEDETSDLAIKQGIYDRGDFWDAITHKVTESENSMTLGVGSPVKHEPYVLGGKVPSWTPLEPIIGWVERKKLAWEDKETGKPLSIVQMAQMIVFSIKKRGIEERNVFAEVIKNKQKWIYDQLNSVNLVIE